MFICVALAVTTRWLEILMYHQQCVNSVSEMDAGISRTSSCTAPHAASCRRLRHHIFTTMHRGAQTHSQTVSWYRSEGAAVNDCHVECCCNLQV